MIIGVPQETFAGECRVAMTPRIAQGLIKAGMTVRLQSGAGVAAGFPDEAYVACGVELVATREQAFDVDVVVQVRAAGANPEGKADLALLQPGRVLIASMDPLSEPEAVRELAGSGVTAFSLELMPRITRAQSMDVLSSMATIAGYHAVLLGAEALPRMFPMMMTAAGTITPARVLVIGAGVAGLQAIATARRLGAVVQGYDIRPAVKEQVESLGAKFVELDLDTGDSEDAGGYAKARDEAFYQRQREAMGRVVADHDVVITTAAIPGRKAPILVTEEMVKGMAPGSVIVDLAAERGGNCACTKAGETVKAHGVQVLGPVNLASSVPYHASQMYARNCATFLEHLAGDDGIKLDLDDEITKGTMVAHRGDVPHERLRGLLGLETPPQAPSDSATRAGDGGEESEG